MAFYYFLDESGDPGFRLEAGASSHFVMVLVQLVERSSIPALDKLRSELHVSQRFEFKYHKLSTYQRQRFFDHTESVPFRVRIAIVDKASVSAQWRRLSGQDLVVELAARLVLRTSALDIANDILVIDGATPSLRRALCIRLTDLCRDSDRTRPFKKIVGGNSRNEDGLQLADMVAGAARHHQLGSDSQYFRTLSPKIVDLWHVSQ